jgi:hypothetical protein
MSDIPLAPFLRKPASTYGLQDLAMAIATLSE